MCWFSIASIHSHGAPWRFLSNALLRKFYYSLLWLFKALHPFTHTVWSSKRKALLSELTLEPDGFPVFIFNGITSEWWEYVRSVIRSSYILPTPTDFTRPTGLDVYGGQWFPNYDWFGEPQVCGVNGTKSGHQVGNIGVICSNGWIIQAVLSLYLPLLGIQS